MRLAKKYFHLKSNAVYNSYSNNIIYETNLVQNIITGIINRSDSNTLDYSLLSSSNKFTCSTSSVGKIKKTNFHVI